MFLLKNNNFIFLFAVLFFACATKKTTTPDLVTEQYTVEVPIEQAKDTTAVHKKAASSVATPGLGEKIETDATDGGGYAPKPSKKLTDAEKEKLKQEMRERMKAKRGQ